MIQCRTKKKDQRSKAISSPKFGLEGLLTLDQIATTDNVTNF